MWKICVWHRFIIQWFTLMVSTTTPNTKQYFRISDLGAIPSPSLWESWQLTWGKTKHHFGSVGVELKLCKDTRRQKNVNLTKQRELCSSLLVIYQLWSLLQLGQRTQKEQSDQPSWSEKEAPEHTLWKKSIAKLSPDLHSCAPPVTPPNANQELRAVADSVIVMKTGNSQPL